MFIFRWLNYQLLKMQWLSDLVQKFVEQVMGLSVQDRLGGSIHFSYTMLQKYLYCCLCLFLQYPTSKASFPLSERKNIRRIQGDNREHYRGFAGYRNTLLFLLVDTVVYWIHQRRPALGDYVLIFNFISAG